MKSDLIVINGKEITKPYFAFDGCHKFYLVDSSNFDALESAGYSLEEDVYPIEDIAKEFFNSCPLRFIEDWGTFEKVIPQCELTAAFKINGKVITLDFEHDTVLENGVKVA